ncbi:MAG: MFS transporter [Candidatus Brockarchaeota archaeon]|nr:MFS transporter [Candidatus Brockarchaeota archaeon]
MIVVLKTAMNSMSVWRRQGKNWKIISMRSMANRFFERLTVDYNSIYISALGADPLQLGLLNGFSNVAGTAISAPFGWIQDRFSLKKIFLTGVVLSVLVTLAFALAKTWVMLIPAMVLSSIAVTVGSCLTICDVSLRDEDRSACKGICDGAFVTPSLLAPALAAFVITHFGGISVEGIRPLYWIRFIAGAVLALVLFTNLKEVARPSPPKSAGFVGDYREVFRRGKALRRWIAFIAASYFSTGMVSPFVQLFAYEVKGADQFIIGSMTTAGLVIQVLFSASMGGFANRIGRKNIIYLVEPLYCASLLALVFAPSPEYLVISSVLGGFRTIAEYVATDPLQVELVPIDCRGRWRGIVGLFGGLASIPAPIVGGMIWEKMGPNYLIFTSMLLGLFVRIPILATIPE